jgi:AcrR family transcriptional regulator
MIHAMTATRPTGTPKLRREVREQQVLDAAAAEFGTAGYGAASLAHIADRVGVSKALVLSYFGSKEALYAACVERAGSGLVAAIEEVITTPLAPAQMADATLAAIFTALEGRPHDWNVINDRSLPDGGPGALASLAVRRTIADQAARGVARLADLELVHDHDDLAVLTEIWMSAVTATVNWWLRHPDRSAAEMAARSSRVLATITNSR